MEPDSLSDDPYERLLAYFLGGMSEKTGGIQIDLLTKEVTFTKGRDRLEVARRLVGVMRYIGVDEGCDMYFAENGAGDVLYVPRYRHDDA